MATPKRKEQTYLNPNWLKSTAALAMKRGTAIVVSKSRQVYGLVPNTGGSVTVFYKGDDEWIDAILAAFPSGAVFPSEGFFGGSNVSKALKAYANIRLPEDGGRAWIDPVTFAVHVKGLGTTIHSATISPNDSPLTALPCDAEPISFGEDVTPGIAKLMAECVTVEASRPALARIVRFEHEGESHLAATDGKSALFQKCGGIPEGFSADPKTVSLFDIKAYGIVSDETNATETRTYVLNDGTTLLERIGTLTAPNYSKFVSSILAATKHKFLGSLELSNLLDEVKEMGLGSNDAYGGVVRFGSDKTELLSMNVPVAEFDAVADFSGLEIDSLCFAAPVLRRISSLGGGIGISLDGGKKIGVCVNAGTIMFAMPLATARASGGNA